VNNPQLSAIIVTWNHQDLLPGCLSALLKQDYAPLEIIVVDNGSHDGSPELILEHFPEVRLWRFPKNCGFSRAVNFGIDRARGDLILSLNPDVLVQPGFLHHLVQAMVRTPAQDERIGSAAPKLFTAKQPDLLDSTGLFVDRQRRPYDRGQGILDGSQFDDQQRIFGACGAAALYRREMLEDVAVDGEYLDSAFFAYYEDADLAWRAQLRGWSGRFVPEAVASHDRGWGDTLRKRGRAPKGSRGPRLALRNRYLMTIKNDSGRYLLADLPRILAAEVSWLAYAGLTQPRALLGWWDLIHALPRAWRKRQQVRRRRTVDDTALRHWFLQSRWPTRERV
jgi:GT2 family glycosyltransferase